MELRNQVALVVGGAGGIGRATALRLAKEGCRVVVAGRTSSKIKAVEAELIKNDYQAVAIEVDVTNPESVKEMVKSAVARFGTVHILVNTMASPIFGSFLDLPDGDWVTVLQVKYLGSVRTMREVIPYMIKQNYGRIVNMSGTGGKEASPLHLPGGSVNAAINLLTKGLAHEMGKHDIRINAVSPGSTATERLMQLMKVTAVEKHSDLETVKQATEKEVPLGRMANPEEIAEVIAFLVSNPSSYINGACIVVDGGSTKSV